MSTSLGGSTPCGRSGKTPMVIQERDILGEVDDAGEHHGGMHSGRDEDLIVDVSYE